MPKNEHIQASRHTRCVSANAKFCPHITDQTTPIRACFARKFNFVFACMLQSRGSFSLFSSESARQTFRCDKTLSQFELDLYSYRMLGTRRNDPRPRKAQTELDNAVRKPATSTKVYPLFKLSMKSAIKHTKFQKHKCRQGLYKARPSAMHTRPKPDGQLS